MSLAVRGLPVGWGGCWRSDWAASVDVRRASFRAGWPRHRCGCLGERRLASEKHSGSLAAIPLAEITYDVTAWTTCRGDHAPSIRLPVSLGCDTLTSSHRKGTSGHSCDVPLGRGRCQDLNTTCTSSFTLPRSRISERSLSSLRSATPLMSIPASWTGIRTRNASRFSRVS